MGRRWMWINWIAAVALLHTFSANAEEDLRAEVAAMKQQLQKMEALQKEVSALRQERIAARPIAESKADQAIDAKYGPGASAVSKKGKLTLGGLIQIWYYGIQNDNLGFFGDLTPDAPLGGDTNETKDNDSFRVRRTQLKFTLDLNDYVRGYVMLDASRDALSFPSLNSNLGTALRGRTNEGSSAVTRVRSGENGAGRFFQDGWIRFRKILPHHEVQIGQYKPFLGEEGIRSAAELDFAERSLIGQTYAKRDLGLTLLGTWWDDRLQYQAGVFNSAGNHHGSSGDYQNRSDDNDEKDIALRLQVRPVWKDRSWGSLELGASTQFGLHGEAGNPSPDGADTGSDPDNPVDGLNLRRTWASRHYAWLYYAPGGPVRGWWLRGEWGWMKDRNAPASVRGFPQSSGTLVQDAPNPFSTQGWYFATGYKVGDSIWAGDVPKAFKNFEFVYRYETFQNVTVGDLVRPETRTDVFATSIHTAGINYYISGHNAKVQANYNWVNDPDEGNNAEARGFREVRNDSFIVNFQVAW
ncbi:MAG: OprO/OprP family phosphate-selective porin [Planctomycetes bacterium]|nr:OprO/OprP family phosphate-selective porin [Planctomycetota bacterium]